MTRDVRLLLERQWAATRRWLDTAGVLEESDRPSGLGTWSVRDLVVHTGRSFQASLGLVPAESGTVPLSIGTYVSAYAAAAQEIALGTHELAESLADTVLSGLDEIVASGLAALARFDEPREVVIGPRGPLTVSDFIMTRLIEVVVHTDDLARALPGLPTPPMDGPALAAVSETLADILTERSGARPAIVDRFAWVRLATGRTSADTDSLRHALGRQVDADIEHFLPLI